ncbi:hypothetical protein [Maribacter sp. 2308TA10-17]|uniref:hypothetical protein n=1 Tax=Maribacter sp. 2308TA10-17 TaxID=3386276 RepID=UPI0039BC42EE
MIKILQFISILSLSLILVSCGGDKEDEINQPSDINDVSNVSLALSEITTTTITTDISYQFSGLNQSDINAKILYRLENETNYKESAEGILNDLEPGKKYLIKGLVEINGEQKESTELTFTTLGFYFRDLNGTIENFENRKYNIFNNSNQSNFTEAADLTGFLKVDNDSLMLENIEVVSDFQIIVTIPINTQTFFENDTNHIIKKEFSIGLFSGDFYTEITESTNGVTNRFWVEETNHFTVYNKIPFIDSVDVSNSHICSETSVLLRVKGGLGGFPNSFVYRLEESEYKSMTIVVRSKEPNNNEILTILDYDSYVLNPSSFDCELEQFKTLEFSGSTVKSMAHTFNFAFVNLNKAKYPSGNYQIEFIGVSYKDETFSSNVFDFTIE